MFLLGVLLGLFLDPNMLPNLGGLRLKLGLGRLGGGGRGREELYELGGDGRGLEGYLLGLLKSGPLVKRLPIIRPTTLL